jgi:hypothetical protein
MTNIIHHLDLLDNRSKNSLIKESEMNNISLLKLSENKNELENKNKNTIVKRVKRKSNALSVDNSKIELSKDKMSKKKDKNVVEYNKENGTINLINVKKSEKIDIFVKLVKSLANIAPYRSYLAYETDYNGTISNLITNFTQKFLHSFIEFKLKN